MPPTDDGGRRSPTRAGVGAALVLALFLSAGCRKSSNGSDVRDGIADTSQPAPPVLLVNRVWERTDSTGLPGVMQIFLDDGTLMMDSSWETYRLARWRMVSDSTVRWQEDGIDVQAMIHSLDDKSLVLRVSRVHGS